MNLSGRRYDATAQLLTQVSLTNTSLALSKACRRPQSLLSETDPVFTAWDRRTGITILENQIVGGITFPVTLDGEETLTNKTIISPLGIVKADIGLSNVDNTSDLSKPLSTAMTVALAFKENNSNKSTNVTTDGASDIKYPSVKAVKTYVDSKVVGLVTHNNTTGLQGGTTNQYYHMSAAQHTIATQSATASRDGYLTATDWIRFNSGAGGSVLISGTPHVNELAIWTNANTIKGMVGLTFDGTDLVVDGNIRATGEVSAYDDGVPLNFWDDMPVATTTTLGAIIVGANLTVDEFGVLNASTGGVGSATWGSIGGTLSDQTDLQTALNNKIGPTGDTTGSSGSVETTDYTITQENGVLVIKYQGDIILGIGSDGHLISINELEAYGDPADLILA